MTNRFLDAISGYPVWAQELLCKVLATFIMFGGLFSAMALTERLADWLAGLV